MSFDRLIILPCHSIWKGSTFEHSTGEKRDEWFLAPFQIEGHDHLCFIDHIEKCIEQLKKQPSALLVISGGQTKKEAGPVSEAYSYFQLARRLLESSADKSLLDRIVLEEYARDSFENVWFSLCRFHDVTSRYPGFITVVGFEFKRKRFIDCHLSEALNYPKSKVEYIGNSPTPGSEIDPKKYFEDLDAAEEKHALRHFESDWYGLRAPLVTKREQRDPFKRHHGYESSNPEMRRLFESLRRTSGLSNEEIRDSLEVSW